MPIPLRPTLKTFLTPGPRMADEAACIASVLLAVALAHAAGARMVGWAAFSAFVLIKGDVAETILRGALRMIGTALGGALALIVVPYAAPSLPLAMLAAGVVGAIGLYGMLTAKRAYAWFLFGLTFCMVLYDRIAHPWLDTKGFVHTRVIEVTAGTIACVLVSVTLRLILRRDWRPPSPPPGELHWNRNAARHAAQTGITLALLPLLNAIYPVPALTGAAVTVMAVMVVPVAGLGGGGLVPVSRRLWHRAIGGVAGGAMALVVLLLAQGNPAVLIAGTVLGIAIGRHIENGGAAHAYIGLQFTLAILVILVPDSYARADIGPGLDRLIGIVVGMALLEPVLLAWHWLLPARGTSGPAMPDRGDE